MKEGRQHRPEQLRSWVGRGRVPERFERQEVRTVSWSPQHGVHSLNVLGRGSVPDPGQRRNLVINAIVEKMAANRPGEDRLWREVAKAVLREVIALVVHKVGDTNARDRYQGLPQGWGGLDASIHMAAAWVLEEHAHSPVAGRWATALIGASGTDDARYLKLARLAGTQAREAAAIDWVVMASLMPFAQHEAAAMGSRSDVTASDLRGIWNQAEGRWHPLAIQMVDPGDVCTETATEALAAFCMGYWPREPRPDGQGILGPCTVEFEERMENRPKGEGS